MPCLYSTQFLACPATPTFSTPTVTDACDTKPTVTFADVTTPRKEERREGDTRTWTAKDACGNTSTASQTVHVVDTTAPVISGVGPAQTIQCPATPTFSTPTASDACDTKPTLTFADVTTPGSCPQAYDVTRTWTAKDGCGNSSTASQTVHVVDTTPPVISGVGPAQTIQCPATPTFSTPTATDACDTKPPLTFADVTTPGNCPQAYDVTRTWTAKDACGNTSTASQTVHVVDTTAPVISGVGPAQTIQCPATPTFSNPTATDACDTKPTVTFADVTTPRKEERREGDTRTWTAKDACGNTSTASQTVHVVDTTAPVISGVGPAQTIQCPATPTFSTPTATDACDTKPTFTFADATTPVKCPQAYDVTRTWTAKDACGNTSTASQTVHV